MEGGISCIGCHDALLLSVKFRLLYVSRRFHIALHLNRYSIQRDMVWPSVAHVGRFAAQVLRLVGRALHVAKVAVHGLLRLRGHVVSKLHSLSFEYSSLICLTG